MTTTLRNVQVARDTWHDGTSPRAIFWRQAADYRIYRDAAMKANAKKSPALPLSLLASALKARMRVDQIAHATDVSPATVSAALKRNGLTGKVGRPGQSVVRQCTSAGPIPISLKLTNAQFPASRRDSLKKGVPAEERARLRADFYVVSERLRSQGLSFTQIAALAGRAVQTVHQWRVRQVGNYPAPTEAIIADLKLAAERNEAILGRARALLETLG